MAFYRLYADFFDWCKRRQISSEASFMWLALVGSRTAHHLGIPGLYYGSEGKLSEDTGLGPRPILQGLEELEKRGMVIRDAPNQLILLNEFPNRALSPGDNTKHIKGIYRKWSSNLPNSRIRDLYPQILAWLLAPGMGKRVDAWGETFGPDSGVEISFSRELIAPVCQPVLNVTGELQQELFFPKLSDTSIISENPNDSVGPESSIDTTRSTIYDIPEGGNGFQGGVGGSPADPNAGSVSDTTKNETADRLYRQEAIRRRQLHPAGRLPPALSPPAVLEVLATASRGRVLGAPYDPGLEGALLALCDRLGSSDIKMINIQHAGELLAAGHLGYRNDLGAKWVAGTGNLFDVIAKAKEWVAAGRPPVEDRRGSRGGMSVDESVQRAEEVAAEARKIEAEGGKLVDFTSEFWKKRRRRNT